ncbi:hypothetical protein ACV342_33100, partial [Pseudomonas aeruginosa]
QHLQIAAVVDTVEAFQGQVQVEGRGARRVELPAGRGGRAHIAKFERTSLKGRLSNGAGLAADIQLQRDAKTPLALSAKLAEVFFRTGNPLAATLADWPELLELGNGRATAASSFQ